MQFVLNDQLISENDLAADLTILNYLREYRQLRGTKEGCASGDCGACTVIVGELKNGLPHYTTVNACIAPIGSVKGRHLVTVEHLASADGLHPSQDALVSHHGSQCGFCTPGFVMSLANLYCEKQRCDDMTATRDEVCEAIAGNLCRCTGYRPIIDAGQAMLSLTAPPFYDNKIIKLLSAPQSNNTSAAYYQPGCLNELNRFMRETTGTRLIAGGTDLMLEVTQHHNIIEKFLDLTQVSELRCCEKTGEYWRIGAALSYSEIDAALAEDFPRLSEFLKRFGSKQIRNRGTLGGNLANASPIADMPPLLMTMDAIVEIGSSTGQRRDIALDSFYLGYKKTALAADEYIIALRFDSRHLNDFHRFFKISKRLEDDISSVMIAVRLSIDGERICQARIALGGMAETPVRAVSAEKALENAALNSNADLEKACSEIDACLSPLSDVRASAAYRMAMAKNLLRKAWMEANGEVLPNLGSEVYA